MRLQGPSFLGSMIFREPEYDEEAIQEQEKLLGLKLSLGLTDLHCREEYLKVMVSSLLLTSGLTLFFICFLCLCLYPGSLGAWEHLVTLVWQDLCVSACLQGSLYRDGPQHLPEAVFLKYHLAAVSHGVWEVGGCALYVLMTGIFLNVADDSSPTQLPSSKVATLEGQRVKRFLGQLPKALVLFKTFPHYCHSLKISFLDETKAA